MVQSMTGYGRAESVCHGRSITVELRSVNSRFFEYSSRVPRGFSFLEDRLKKLVTGRVSRGKVELNLSVQNLQTADVTVQVNWELAQNYRDALRQMAEKLDLRNDLTTGLLARFPDVLVQKAAALDEDALWADVEAVAGRAVDAFLEMRTAEGEKLEADVLSRLDTIEACVGEVEKDSAGRVKAYTDRLYAKLKEILEDRNVDEARVLTEAAVFADKTAVDEETVRLRSHIAQYRAIMKSGEPVGRKLDFLTQELNRETNTIGSKCQDIAITRVVVEMKAEIEKIREQIQNIE